MNASSPWPNVHENPGPRAPGRYCLAICYCGDCDHYRPLPDLKPGKAAQIHHPMPDAVWWEIQRREDLRR